YLRAGRVLVDFFAPGDSTRQKVANGKSVLCEIDCFGQYLSEAHRTPAIKQDVPRIDRAGHGTREQSVIDRNLAAVVFLVPLDVSQLWRGTLRVKGKNLFRSRVIN